MQFDSWSELNDHLVRKALKGSLVVAREDATMIDETTLFGADGTLAALPTGWADGGLTTPEGLRPTRSTERSGVPAWQRTTPVRTDKTSDEESIAVDFIETNKTSIELYTGADLTNATVSSTGVLSIKKPAVPRDPHWRLLALTVDVYKGLEYYYAIAYPRAQVSEYADQALARGDNAVQWGMTFNTYFDAELGYSKNTIFGGPGMLALAADMGFAVAAAGA